MSLENEYKFNRSRRLGNKRYQITVYGKTEHRLLDVWKHLYGKLYRLLKT